MTNVGGLWLFIYPYGWVHMANLNGWDVSLMFIVILLVCERVTLLLGCGFFILIWINHCYTSIHEQNVLKMSCYSSKFVSISPYAFFCKTFCLAWSSTWPQTLFSASCQCQLNLRIPCPLCFDNVYVWPNLSGLILGARCPGDETITAPGRRRACLVELGKL